MGAIPVQAKPFAIANGEAGERAPG